MASAGLYANLHLDPDTRPCLHPTTQFFTDQMRFLPPNQHHQSSEGKIGNIFSCSFYYVLRVADFC